MIRWTLGRKLDNPTRRSRQALLFDTIGGLNNDNARARPIYFADLTFNPPPQTGFKPTETALTIPNNEHSVFSQIRLASHSPGNHLS